MISQTSTDAELVDAIARHQDHSAFTLLYERFAPNAFALAIHLTGNRAWAEEALQETMLKVWQSAHRFREDGEVRSWIMCLLTSISLKRRRRHQREREIVKHALTTKPEAPIGNHIENDELLKTLKKKIGLLPEDSRKLLALYFLGGLTQMEIGRQLSMPQRTVSKRITETLSLLKIDLAKAGFTGTTVALFFKDFFVEGVTIQPEWIRHIQATIAETNSSGIVTSTASTTAVLPWIAAIVFCGVSAVAMYYVSTQSPAAPPAISSASPPSAQHISLPVQWEFTKGPPPELEVTAGAWHWWKGFENRKSAMVFPARTEDLYSGIVLLKGTIPHKPLLITIHSGGLVHGPGRAHITLAWANQDGLVPMKTWGIQRKFETRQQMSYQIYMYDKWTVAYSGGELIYLSEFEHPYPGDRLCVLGNNMIVEGIKIKALDDHEFPEHVKNPKEILRQASAQSEMPPVLQKKSFRPFTKRLSPRSVHDQWMFSSGLPDDWVIEKGSVQHVPATKSLHVPFKSPSVPLIRLPSRHFVQPFILEIKAKITIPKRAIRMVGFWGSPAGASPLTSKKLRTSFKKFERDRVELFKIYFINRFAIHCVQDKPVLIIKHERFYPAGGTCFQFSNMSIQEVTRRLLTSEEIPKAFRDPEAFYQKRKDGPGWDGE